MTGVDSSPDALALATENATRLGLAVELRLGGTETAEEGWDLVVSNPPYIPQEVLPSLQPELTWEPPQALVEAALHEEIARRARTHWLVLEVGYGQAARVARALQEFGYHDVAITRDLAGIERVVEGVR